MTDLYRRLTEFSRVVENVILTDEGVYKEKSVPDTYGGAQLKISICHKILFADARGQVVNFDMENKEPLNKDRSEKRGAIKLDGVAYRGGDGGEDRAWTTVVATVADNDDARDAASRTGTVIGYMNSDGPSGTVI